MDRNILIFLKWRAKMTEKSENVTKSTAKRASTRKKREIQSENSRPRSNSRKTRAKKDRKKQKSIVFRLIITGIIMILLVFTAVFLRKKLASQKNTLGSYRVTRESKEDVIEIAGNIEAAESQELQALDDGSVVAVFVKEGDRVKKGDVILQLDDTTQRYNLANLDYSIEQKRVTGSQRELELLYVQRKSLVQKVNERKICATFDGIIVDLDVSTGDYLEAKDSIGTLVNLSYLTAEVEVAETDVAKLIAGQKVLFNFPAYPDEEIEGYLVGYPAIGEITSRGATVVNVVARIDEYPPEILPNYSFTGKIEISSPVDLLLVNRLAVAYDSGRAYVEKITTKSGDSEKIFVELEPYGVDYVNILSGLSEGDMVKQLSEGSISGRFRNNRQKNSKNKNNGKGEMQGAANPPPPMM